MTLSISCPMKNIHSATTTVTVCWLLSYNTLDHYETNSRFTLTMPNFVLRDNKNLWAEDQKICGLRSDSRWQCHLVRAQENRTQKRSDSWTHVWKMYREQLTFIIRQNAVHGKLRSISLRRHVSIARSKTSCQRGGIGRIVRWSAKADVNIRQQRLEALLPVSPHEHVVSQLKDNIQ